MEDPDPVPSVLQPTIVGTWQHTIRWTDRATQADRHAVLWLTFVGERAILVESGYTEGEFNYSHAWESGFEFTDTTVTRLTFESPRNDREGDPIHGSLEKSYYWANEDRSAVFMQSWLSETANPEFFRWKECQRIRFRSFRWATGGSST